MSRNNTFYQPSDVSLLKKELKRERYKQKYMLVIKSTVFTLVTVAAVAVLIATLWLPVLQIYGSSMTPSLHDGDIVVSSASNRLGRGDIVAFYYNNKVLVKRVIACPGEWVDIDEEGNVSVDNFVIDEPYVDEKAFGDCNIELPYQVPENKYFVMGDHRSVSLDSRNAAIGCVSEEQIVGRIIFRVWPLSDFGSLE